MSSPNFNNEKAFYDCLDAYLVATPANPDAGAPDADAQAAINACAAGKAIYFEPPGDGDAQMSVEHTGNLWLDVYALAGPGESAGTDPITSATPGESVDFTARRLQAFAVFDESGACVGAIKAWESRNSITLP